LHISDLRDLYLGSGHTPIMYHSEASIYKPNLVQIGKIFRDGRMDI